MKPLVLFLFALFLIAAQCRRTQLSTCDICREIFTALISAVGHSVTEDEINVSLRFICSSFGTESWCQKNVYTNIHDIFLALRSNKTDDVICERLALCRFKIVSITGDVLFADDDILYTVHQVPNTNVIEHRKFGSVNHTLIPSGEIAGLACSVDYCAVLLKGTDASGKTIYGTTALSPYMQKNQILPAGVWYGPWFDIMTQEFWMATGTSREFTFGIFDPQYGNWEPKVSVRLRVRFDTQLLSGQILNRVLYFTLFSDPHVYSIDLIVRLFRGNFSAPNNTMLVGNIVTNELYGYSPSINRGVYLFSPNGLNRTTVAIFDFSSTQAVPASTINPIDKIMWISCWGKADHDAWVLIDLKKKTNNVGYASLDKLDGLFDFNPYTIVSEEV